MGRKVCSLQSPKKGAYPPRGSSCAQTLRCVPAARHFGNTTRQFQRRPSPNLGLVLAGCSTAAAKCSKSMSHRLSDTQTQTLIICMSYLYLYLSIYIYSAVLSAFQLYWSPPHTKKESDCSMRAAFRHNLFASEVSVDVCSTERKVSPLLHSMLSCWFAFSFELDLASCFIASCCKCIACKTHCARVMFVRSA